MYLSKMTVAELKSIAEQMNLKVPSAMRKAEIVAFLTERINGWHVIALDMNREYVARPAASTMKTMTVKDRMGAYKRQTGGYLTNRQQRRIAKKYKHALAKGFDLDTVMGAEV
jgi:hypothetical protein